MTIAESTTERSHGYEALRGSVGLVSYDGVGLLRVHGLGASTAVSQFTTRSADFLLEGQSQHCLALREDGTIVTDVVVHGLADGYLLQIPGAALEEAQRLLSATARETGADIEDQSGSRALLGVEGPRSYPLVQPLLDFPISSLGYQASTPGRWRDLEVVVTRAGVTGEYGYTVLLPADALAPMREDLIDQGAEPTTAEDVAVCMMEMRFPRLSAELFRAGITPFDLGVQWMVDFANDARGVSSLMDHTAELVPVCWQSEGAGTPVPEPGSAVSASDGQIGEVIHAVRSPLLEAVIGTALIDADCAAPGLALEIDGEWVDTVSAPFLVATSFSEPME